MTKKQLSTIVKHALFIATQNGKLGDMCEDIWHERRPMPLSAASFLSGFLNRPKASRGKILTAARTHPCATEQQQDFNASPDRAEPDILRMILDGGFWPIQAAFVVGEPLSDVGIPS